MLRTNSIFISYSHRDTSWKDSLLTHLAALQDVTVDAWDDTRIRGGDDWLGEIDSAMGSAKIAVLLVSADFLASPFINDHEVPRLLERHAVEGLRIYPIIVRQCPWKRVHWLGGFQARPVYAEPLGSLPDHCIDSALSSAAEEIQDLLRIESLPDLPPLGAVVSRTGRYQPPLLIGLRVFPAEPLRLDFVMTQGEESLLSKALREVAVDLVGYFLTCLTVREEDLWVNLSPEEPNKIIPKDLAGTRMGHVLLQQDYIIKQFSSSLMLPETDSGKQFWEHMYSAVDDHRDTPVNTWNKIWIVPATARVWERDGLCLITAQSLRAMLDEDYRSLSAGSNDSDFGTDLIADEKVSEISSLASARAKRLLLPTMEREVNSGRNFAPLRQIYHALILARWYREVVAQTLLKQTYVDGGRLSGLRGTDRDYPEKVYQQYLETFKMGVFNFIHEDYDAESQEVIPRKYFSGGILARAIGSCLDRQTESAREQAADVLASQADSYLVRVSLYPLGGGEDSERTNRTDESVGGIDLTMALGLSYEPDSGETQLEPDALREVVEDSNWGLTVQIEEIRGVETLDQLVDFGRGA